MEKDFWDWNKLRVAWCRDGSEINSDCAVILIHGFGASKEHWRNNQPIIGKVIETYAIDLIGFGESSQPKSTLKGEHIEEKSFEYCFDNWSKQIETFCKKIVKKPVILIGNSIGGVIALNTAKKLKNQCIRVICIDCAQRTMDDKRLYEQSITMRLLRPALKQLVRQRFISENLFKNLAKPSFIEKILQIAYPSGSNIDNELIQLLYKPTQRPLAAEAFRGFINLFDDLLAPQIMKGFTHPVDLIWGEKDPWEPIEEAHKWYSSIPCIKTLEIIYDAGHCPHDEFPDEVNSILLKIIQQAT